MADRMARCTMETSTRRRTHGRTGGPGRWLAGALLVLALVAPLPGMATTLVTQSLDAGWQFRLAPGDSHAAAHPRTTQWLPATVPGTVLASLVEQGHFPDPVDGFSNLHIPEALSRHSWWYRRAFRLPADFSAAGPGRRVWLEFDGINHQAEIWLNGSHVAELTHPFARGAFDVTSVLTSGEQVLAVEISPMPHPGSPGDKGPSGVSFLNSSMVSLDFPSYISVSGWDWMPAVRDRVSGIWDHVWLRSTGPAVLGDQLLTVGSHTAAENDNAIRDTDRDVVDVDGIVGPEMFANEPAELVVAQ